MATDLSNIENFFEESDTTKTCKNCYYRTRAICCLHGRRIASPFKKFCEDDYKEVCTDWQKSHIFFDRPNDRFYALAR